MEALMLATSLTSTPAGGGSKLDPSTIVPMFNREPTTTPATMAPRVYPTRWRVLGRFS